jgi:hypothetical protein
LLTVDHRHRCVPRKRGPVILCGTLAKVLR